MAMMKKQPRRYEEIILATERSNQPSLARRSTANLHQLISVKPKVNFQAQSIQPIKYVHSFQESHQSVQQTQPIKRVQRI